MPKQVQPTMMFLVLDYVYSKMKKDLNRKLLVIDEAWSLLSKTKEASYIFEIVKTCRKFNLGLFLINQEVEDMLNSKAGRSVLANSTYTLLLRQKPAVINDIQRVFNLSDTERITLLTSLVGEGILIMEDEHSKIRIVASKEEHNIITTNADEILENRKNNHEIPKSKDKKNINIELERTKKLFKKNKLSKEELSYLIKKRYIEFEGYSIASNKKEKYLIKPRFNETSQHCFLVYDIADFLSKFKAITNIQTPETKKPDIIFTIKNKEFAIEVETGSLIKTNKKALLEKIKELKKDYKENWFFALTNKKLTTNYKRLGKAYDRRTLKNQLIRLTKSSKKH